MSLELADSHGHLTMVFEPGTARGPSRRPNPNELRAMLERAREAGVTRVLVPATSREDARFAVEIAEANDGVHAAVGFHPHEVSDFDEDRDLKLLDELSKSRSVVAVGEIGLDYFYDRSPREKQQRALIAQLRFAVEKGLPVLLHNRESEADLLPILAKESMGSKEDLRGVFHSFCADVETGRRALELGYLVSFSGMLTFGTAENVRRAARELPLESFLIETDAPFLAPVPHRGRPNEPSYLRRTAEKLAEVKGVTLEEVATATTKAYQRLFKTS